MKNIIFYFLIFNSNWVFSQISLPKGFKCVDMRNESHYRDNYFTDGVYSFHSEIWGRDFTNEKDFLNYFTEKYEIGRAHV